MSEALTMPGSLPSAGNPTSSDRYIACIPIFNDWASARVIVERLLAEARTHGRGLEVLLVDDGSTEAPSLESWPCREQVRVLRLRRNLGHQRSITIGLTYIYNHLPCRGVIVLDGDGEDNPADVETLLRELEAAQYQAAVFAQRQKRTESLLFRFFYWVFRLVHWTLTGRKVEVGNFSVLPFAMLGRLVGVSEMWNHYAAAVVKALLPRRLIPLARGHRLHGQSRMNFVSLVTHGLSAISVFSDEIGVRLLVGLTGAFVLLCVAFVTVWLIGPEVGATWWMMARLEPLLLTLLLCLFLAVAFVLIILQGRNLNAFIPQRDYEVFIL
ncbi:MAG TPA: glycosyltransferase, partial [Gemmatales bacterium]|nr:glycosyltransferase [Gemmatales bacterium]